MTNLYKIWQRRGLGTHPSCQISQSLALHGEKKPQNWTLSNHNTAFLPAIEQYNVQTAIFNLINCDMKHQKQKI